MEQNNARTAQACPDSCPASQEAWARVERALPEAKAAFYDGCHGIYLAMDDAQVDAFEQLGAKAHLPDLEQIRGWFEGSCEFRFVESLRTHTKKNGDAKTKCRELIAAFELEDA